MDFSNLITMLAELQEKINSLTQALADGDAFARAQYDAGYAAGIAAGGGDVQAQIDAAVAAAVGPLNEQIMALGESIAALQVQIDGIPGQIAVAVKSENDRVVAVLQEEKTKLVEKIMPALDEAAETLLSKIVLP